MTRRHDGKYSLPVSTSAQQLVTYAECPRKYACRFLLGLNPETRVTELQSALEGRIQRWFREKLAGGSAAIEEVVRHTALRSPLRHSVRNLLREYLQRFGNQAIAAVGLPFEVDLNDPTEVSEPLSRTLKGSFPLVLEDGTAVCFAASEEPWPAHLLERDLGIGACVFAWNAFHGGPSKVEVHVLTGSIDTRVDVYPIERGEPDTAWWFDAVAAIERAIESGYFPPSPGHQCSDCEYQLACSHWHEAEREFERPF